jgi:hypothetical protein
MALIVLGAGATRGASFAEGKNRPLCLPPLDGDFFTQLQRISEPKHQATVDQLIETAVELFGHNFQCTLETLFTTIEHQLRIASGLTGDKWGTSKAELEKKRGQLLQAIAAVLEESLTTSPDGGTGHQQRDCSHHKQLVTSLTGDDAIVSFNYDCLIDHTLQKHGDAKWNTRYGYCLPLRKGKGSSLGGEGEWNPTVPCEKGKSIRVLKLHGSLNFYAKSATRFILKSRPYTKNTNGQMHFEIIPPEWNKQFDKGVFKRIWMQAAREIRHATTIVVIGYSFPLTDLHTASLFRVAVNPEKLRNLVLVNPDREARRRTMRVLARGMNAKTRVMVFDYFKEFAAVERSVWDRK